MAKHEQDQAGQVPQAVGRPENDGGGCTLAGPGRGDCFHFIGLPGHSIPGQHDGPDDTVDVYGKPNGWCWSCWRAHQLAQARDRIEWLASQNAEKTAYVLMAEGEIQRLREIVGHYRAKRRVDGGVGHSGVHRPWNASKHLDEDEWIEANDPLAAKDDAPNPPRPIDGAPAAESAD